MEKKLIEKLTDKFADFKYAVGHSKIGKRILTLTLAGAMLVPVALYTSACSLFKNDQGTTTPGTTTPGTTTPGTNPGTNPGGTTDEPNLSGYSDILKTVLTSDYYKDLSEIPGANMTLTSQKRQQNPFGFLYQQEYDLNPYIDGELEITSDVYIKGNNTSNLYIATRVESEHPQGNYYTCYVLKYELTKQEYNDLKMLHEGEYVQAPLFIQELTYEKEPTIESEAKLSKRIYTSMKDNIRRNKDFNIFNGNSFEIDFTGYNAESGLRGFTYSVNIKPSKKGNEMILPDNKIYHLTIKTVNVAGDLAVYGNNIFNGPLTGTATNLEQYQTKYETITYFESDDYKVNATVI